MRSSAGRQGVDPALAGSGKHRGEGLLEAGLDARPVAHLGQLVGHEPPVVGEDVEQAAHVLEFHCWCRACGWTGDVVRVERMVGYEPQ